MAEWTEKELVNYGSMSDVRRTAIKIESENKVIERIMKHKEERKIIYNSIHQDSAGIDEGSTGILSAERNTCCSYSQHGFCKFEDNHKMQTYTRVEDSWNVVSFYLC